MIRKIPLILIFVLTSCDYVDDTLSIKNETEKDVYCFINIDSLEHMYKPNVNQSYKGVIQSIKPGIQRKILIPGPHGEAWINYVLTAHDSTLNLYLFSRDTLEKYTWSEIIKNKRYDTILKFHYNILKKKKWMISVQ